MHCFQIADAEWERIKLNIDSKCRTAYRRKRRGLPLQVKSFQTRSDKVDEMHETEQVHNQIRSLVLHGSSDQFIEIPI